MAQPEAHEIPTRHTPVHWRNEEITALVNHMYNNCASGDTSSNFKPQTVKMVKSKWASLKSIHHAIDKSPNQTSIHWDSANGAGIHGPAASAVWDLYVVLSEIIPLGGTRGCHAFQPAVMGPPPVADADEDEPGLAQAPALSSASPSSTSGPSTTANHSSVTGPSFTTSPHSNTGAKRPYEAGLHHLGVRPPSKKAHSHVSQKMTNAAKMSSATQATKITPAAAVMGMQGTVNHLTDVFERFIVSTMNSGTLPPPPPPGPEPEGSMDLVARTAHLLQTEDAGMPPEQCTVLIMVLGEKNNESFLKFYVSLMDKETRCPFIQKLITDAMAG
ncbi:uncharacterized protein HD556DRAFT_1308507 [Suillus plorans]|uniref:Myb/SANT-like domain-containing protein n=1 Tax=Suillus plorans TaxID=116603 RepID=A0A9P7AP99_9AGAM|nr:uncharacterized protein HD556DRAFT_1308507 [Suillus plorans]KAG1793657.1 hypothetical protein HD556DRAFT_1308507 [Suillus plorans]